jgi:murein tripeptide amidase MpaA
MAAISFDHLYRYDELTAALQSLAVEFPALLTVESVGRSYEGRDIWLATVTNTATGMHDEKPAIWADANIHSIEHTGSLAALYLIHKLVHEHGSDPLVTKALDTRTFYVMPRVNPDGAELALADAPQFLRSSVRKWPRTDDQPGLVEHDVDGDGRLLTMRVPDSNGPWKVSDRDSRLLVARTPSDIGDGPYFRLLYEGTIRDYDGMKIAMAPERRSLDLNRQFPAGWRVHGEQFGAGPFPLSEPETRTLAEALVARPNVCCYFAHHTFSAVLLRPFDDRPDSEFPTIDLKTYNALGARGTEFTGYRHVGVYNDFRYDPKDVITGGADTWVYDHLGVFGWTTEFWSPLPHAGITDYHLVDWFADHPIEHDLQLLAYSDNELDGKGFVDWYQFDHPQLGTVEIGGWDTLRFWCNPPDHLLEPEIRPHADWQIYCALAAPQLRIRETRVEQLSADTWRVRVAIENCGWLPTNVTQRAVDKKIAQSVEACLELPSGATFASGVELMNLGQLQGHARVTTMLADFGGVASDETPDIGVAEWIVRAERASAVQLTARHPKAGVVRSTITLE